MRILTLIFYTIVFLQQDISAQDSAIVAASTRYNTRSVPRLVFVGKNYRSTWSLQVKMPVFDISRENGGMVIVKLGGRQTKSLYMHDKGGIQWVLRTVDKSFEKFIPRSLKHTFVEKDFQDMVSASYPYAALIVPTLAKALGLNAPDPKLFFVPNDTAFGEYRQAFANTVCTLEKSEPSLDNTPTESTDSVLKKITGTTNYRVDDSDYLKARLLDMLIGDWDRHKDQYKWGIFKYKAETVFYPIPRDRDQAFYHSNGLSLKFMRLFAVKYMTGFTTNTRKLRQLNYKAWDLDKTILGKLDEQQWRRIIHEFQQTMNDDVLLSAVYALPAEVNQKDAGMIFTKLKARRDHLAKDVMKYYAFVSKRN